MSVLRIWHRPDLPSFSCLRKIDRIFTSGRLARGRTRNLIVNGDLILGRTDSRSALVFTLLGDVFQCTVIIVLKICTDTVPP